MRGGAIKNGRSIRETETGGESKWSAELIDDVWPWEREFFLFVFFFIFIFLYFLFLFVLKSLDLNDWSVQLKRISERNSIFLFFFPPDFYLIIIIVLAVC